MRFSIWTLVIAVALGVAGGFVAGRASGAVDDPKLRADLELWKGNTALAIAQRDSSREKLTALQGFIAGVNAEADLWRARALASEARANQHGRQADSLMRLLAGARTPRDSASLLVNACTERALECASIRIANAELLEAAGKDKIAKDSMTAENAEHLKQRARDSTNAEKSIELVKKLDRAARGCRLPLVGLPCPMLVGEYSLDDRAFRVGGAIPVKLGPLGRVLLSVTTRVSNEAKP